MSVYKEYKQLNQPAIEQEILHFWKEHHIFQRSISERDGADAFIFYEGPPSANGLPGIHHVMARAIKDIFCRYQTLKGKQVLRKAGWDTHGLPIELAVEKTLGIRKDDIGKSISIEDYNKACRNEVMKYTDKWEELTEKMGYWVDMKNPYITYENKYIESVWWLLKQLHEKALLYKGYTVQPYSPAAGTGLSSHELNQPGCYKPVKDTSVVAQFRVIPDNTSRGLFGENEIHLLAWTTTPWTLPSNTALAVGKNITYVLVKSFNPYTSAPVNVIIAKELCAKYFPEKNATLPFDEYQAGDKNIPFTILKTYLGNELEGLRYEQLLPYAQPLDGDAFRVVIGDFVSTEDGTGIVHIAPSFGADDFRTAKQYGIGSLTLVDKQGRFTEAMGELAGEYVKEAYLSDTEKEESIKKQGGEKYLSADERIAIKLKKENKAFKVEKYEHNYPHCWRTDKPILYYPLDSWFIKTTAAKDRMVELNKTINWKPESTGTGRFGNWLENLQDWNLSRSRFWGIPLPIWRTDDGIEEKCIGSLDELKLEIDRAKKAGIPTSDRIDDLHRPYVDDIVLISPGGKPMRRETDLIDVWFDSGAMPYAQLHYPFDTNDLVGKFPADFIAEGVDQTRGWFFTLHAIATMCFDSVAYKTVVSNGLVLDKNGNKMSKRLGNAVDPFDTIALHSADATRWYMIANAAPWDNLKFDVDGIQEVRRKLFGTLFNTYNFFALYANVDGFISDGSNGVPVAERNEMDRWIISKLQSLVEDVSDCYDTYEPHRAARAIELFVDEHLSNWYIRLSRRRFWKSEMNADKRAAYETLFECLWTTAQLMSPIAPFFSEWLYQNITAPIRNAGQDNKLGMAKHDSIHLTKLLHANKSKQDKELELRMDLAQTISSLSLSLRKKANIKVRQPLNRILIPILQDEFKSRIEAVSELIKSEINVKHIDFIGEDSDIVKKKAKANFKVLGARLGKKMKEASLQIASFDHKQIQLLEQSGSLTISIEHEPVDIQLADVEIISEDLAGWSVASEKGITVALDVTVTKELVEEGIARELINRIQKIRKERSYNVTDRIAVELESKDFLFDAVNNYKGYICNEVLADSLQFSQHQSADAEIIDVNENELKIKVSKS
ncbi:isoleucine--tRNA ligase [Bacteroidota bacterium]|nr:isoleucine--tRNA ligase [Bacteroidota bacterium]